MRERLRDAGREAGRAICSLAGLVLYICCCCRSEFANLGRRSCVVKLKDYPDVPEPPLRPLPATRPGTPSSNPNLQTQCLLLTRLPVEIRLLIWEIVLGPRFEDDCLHLDIRDGILWYRQCWETKPERLKDEAKSWYHVCWSSALWYRYEGRKDDGFMEEEPRTGRGFLTILLSCKTIYAEAIGILYQSNRFDFRRAASLARLPHIMLPHRFQQLRNLSLHVSMKGGMIRLRRLTAEQQSFSLVPTYRSFDENQSAFWLEACDVLASLKQLQRLRITIFTNSTFLPMVDEESVVAVLEPLRDVHASVFTVLWVEALEEGAMEKLQGFPFPVAHRTTESMFEGDTW